MPIPEHLRAVPKEGLWRGLLAELDQIPDDAWPQPLSLKRQIDNAEHAQSVVQWAMDNPDRYHASVRPFLQPATPESPPLPFFMLGTLFKMLAIPYLERQAQLDKLEKAREVRAAKTKQRRELELLERGAARAAAKKAARLSLVRAALEIISELPGVHLSPEALVEDEVQALDSATMKHVAGRLSSLSTRLRWHAAKEARDAEKAAAP